MCILEQLWVVVIAGSEITTYDKESQTLHSGGPIPEVQIRPGMTLITDRKLQVKYIFLYVCRHMNEDIEQV